MLVKQTPERDFRIRISGLEIYNENVKDLLNSDSGHNAKLLDDPEVISKETCLRFDYSSFFTFYLASFSPFISECRKELL